MNAKNVAMPAFRAVAIATTMATAGCVGVPVISNAIYESGYTPLEWSGAGDLPVVVRGNPYSVPQSEFDQAVTDDLQGTVLGFPTHFIPASSGPAAVYRVVMMFNPPSGIGASALCARPEPPNALLPAAAPAARVPLSAALCRGDTAVSAVNGWIGTGGKPRSAELKWGISNFGYSLFPPSNPDDPPGPEFSS